MAVFLFSFGRKQIYLKGFTLRIAHFCLSCIQKSGVGSQCLFANEIFIFQRPSTFLLFQSEIFVFLFPFNHSFCGSSAPICRLCRVEVRAKRGGVTRLLF